MSDIEADEFGGTPPAGIDLDLGIEIYEKHKDEFLALVKKYWKNPYLNIYRDQATEEKDKIQTLIKRMMIKTFDDDDTGQEERTILTINVGLMCVDGIVDGLNETVNSDIFEKVFTKDNTERIKRHLEEVNPEDIVDIYADDINYEIETVFDEFCGCDHFKRAKKFKETSKYFSVLLAGIAIGKTITNRNKKRSN